MPSARYTGTFFIEETSKGAYGFVKDISHGCGKCSADVPQSIFLRAGVAKGTLGNKKNLLAGLNGGRISFDIRASQLHPGKKEACNVLRIEDPQYALG